VSETKNEASFFLSYSGEDLGWAKWIAWQLEESKYEVYYQHQNFIPGKNIPESINEALSKTDFTFALISPNFLKSEFCKKEWQAAWMSAVQNKSHVLVPIWISEFDRQSLPPLLSAENSINLINLDEHTSRDTLVAGVVALIKQTYQRQYITPIFPSLNKQPPTPPVDFPGELRKLRRLPLGRNINFIGRDEYLDNLNSNLNSGVYSALTQAAHGLGGVGKTQLANEYAHDHIEDYDVVWWIRSEKMASLKADLLELASRAGFPYRNEDELLRNVLEWLENTDRWLLVFDNAEHPSAIENYLPRSNKGHIIITSRYRAWGDIAGTVKVDVFTRNQSIAFLNRRTKLNDSNGASLLAEALGDLPLALAQAAAYLEESGLTYFDYLKLFNKHRLLLLEEGRLSSEVYPDSVATTWDITLLSIKETCPAAVEVLKIIAYFAPDDIPKDIFIRAKADLPDSLKDIVEDDLQMNNTWRMLYRYSLIESADTTVSLHRIVRAAIQFRLGPEQSIHYCQSALDLIDHCLKYNENDQSTWVQNITLVPHAIALSSHMTLGLNYVQAAKLIDRAASILWKNRRIEDSMECYRYALNLARHAVNVEGQSIEGSVWNNLSVVLKEAGDLPGV